MKKYKPFVPDGNKTDSVSPPEIAFEYVPRFVHDAYDYMEDEYGYIGYDTPDERVFPAVNLLECLLDTERAFPAKQYKLFRVIEDCGVRELSCGNHGGGVFAGEYRSFLIDYKGKTEFVSLGFSTYRTHCRPDYIRTALHVAIGDEKASHHSLQYIIDKNLGVLLDKVAFYHDGSITVGNIGSGKREELKAFVRKSYPDILSKDEFCLGVLTYDRQWNLDDSEVMSVIENFISYALIRDEYREYRKREHEKRLKESG